MCIRDRNYYGERCLEYLFNGSKGAVKVYRWLYILAVFIGPYMTVAAVWTIADIFNGLMAIPNIIALFALGGVVAKDTREYPVSYTHLRAHETRHDLVCRLLLEKKKKNNKG